VPELETTTGMNESIDQLVCRPKYVTVRESGTLVARAAKNARTNTPRSAVMTSFLREKEWELISGGAKVGITECASLTR